MTWNRAISLVVAGPYLAILGLYYGSEAVYNSCIILVLPMACIWFGDEMGRYTGVRFGILRPYVTDTSPGVMVRVCGWLVLLVIVSVTLFVRFRVGK